MIRLTKYLDFLKGYSRTALVFSTHTAAKSVANSGGSGAFSGATGPRNWICNSAIPPDVNEVRFFLSNETLRILNTFIENENKIKKDEMIDYFVEKFKCVDYDVSEYSVDSGVNDLRFNVGAYGSTVNASFKTDSVVSQNDIYLEISKIRFWYMYRVFKNWVKDITPKLMTEVCGCEETLCLCPEFSKDSCEKCEPLMNCIRYILDSARKELEERLEDNDMDDGIDFDCDVKIDCCYAEMHDCEEYEIGCKDWKNYACYECVKPENVPDTCSKSFIFSTESVDYGSVDYENLTILSLNPGTCGVCRQWRKNKASVIATFYCTDKKYALSVEDVKHLTFGVKATISLEKPVSCEYIEECEEYYEYETITYSPTGYRKSYEGLSCMCKSDDLIEEVVETDVNGRPIKIRYKPVHTTSWCTVC